MSEAGIDVSPAPAADASSQAVRSALAADLHDGLGSALSYAKFRLPLLADAIAAGDRAQAERHLGVLRDALGQAQATLRGLLTQLRAAGAPEQPPGATPSGLAEALAGCAAEFERQGTLPLSYFNAAPQAALPPGALSELVQIAREALCNVARHAGASRVWMRLEALAGGVQLVVEDDGAGLSPAPASAGPGNHQGLSIMRERAQRLGATLVVAPGAGGAGTRVALSLPLPVVATTPTATPDPRAAG